MQEDPGSNPAKVSICLIFTETFLNMAQLDRAKSCAFLKFSGQELSESVVKVSGNLKFTRLDVREQCLTLQMKSFRPLRPPFVAGKLMCLRAK